MHHRARQQRLKDQQAYNRLKQEMSRLTKTIEHRIGSDFFITRCTKTVIAKDFVCEFFDRHQSLFTLFRTRYPNYTPPRHSIDSLITRLFTEDGNLVTERCFDVFDDENKLNKDLPFPTQKTVYYTRPDGSKRNAGKRQYIISRIECIDKNALDLLLEKFINDEMVSSKNDRMSTPNEITKEMHENLFHNEDSHRQWCELKVSQMEGLTIYLILWVSARFAQDFTDHLNAEDGAFGLISCAEVVVPTPARNTTIKGKRRNPWCDFLNRHESQQKEIMQLLKY